MDKQSRRAILTAALAGTAAGTATLAGHVALAASAGPDPIFALIEAEARAYAAIDEALAPMSAAEDAFYASGYNRAPRVQTGTMTTIVDRDLNPIPGDQWKAVPVYVYSREEIERTYGSPAPKPLTLIDGDRKITSTVERSTRRDVALAAFDAEENEIAAARERCGLVAAEVAFHAACGAHDDALVAVFTARPTTLPGLVAMLDLFERREVRSEHSELLEDICAGLVAAVRAVVT